MNWSLSQAVDLANDRISDADSRRQMETASEILRRLNKQSGLVLADEVGMGKTFVALAVAASVIETTGGDRPVVVMVPPSVQEKWPREWETFKDKCLDKSLQIRATTQSVRRGAAFLKLLDDPASRRHHMIFLTHGALTSSLQDPFVRLALVRQAFIRRSGLKSRRRVFPRWASEIIPDRRFRNAALVEDLLNSSYREWLRVYKRHDPRGLDDDPIPEALIGALAKVDLSQVRDVLSRLPLRDSKYRRQILTELRKEIQQSLNQLWRKCLAQIDIHLPLLVLDEAHHLKNPRTRFSSLFATESAAADAKLLEGPLAQVFDRMLFLTATPFQLGHHELVQVLRRFEGIRWGNGLNRGRYKEEVDELERRLNVAQTAALRLDRVWGRLRTEDLPSGDWWQSKTDNGNLASALAMVDDVNDKVRYAEAAVGPWMIRHARPDRDRRRAVHSGRGIYSHADGELRGLPVVGSAVLPFLLAARAQAVVAAEGQRYGAHTRAYFAEGLASSFEAYRETRKREEEDLLDDAEQVPAQELSDQTKWYLDSVDSSLPEGDATVWSGHPKIRATVERALALWEDGEKVLVFCFYRQTGRALRTHISKAVDDLIVAKGAQALGLDPNEPEAVRQALERFSDRFFDPDAPVTRLARRRIRAIMDLSSTLGDDERARTEAVALRFLRTPSFLVRYFDLSQDDREVALVRAFAKQDGSGMSLEDKIRSFARFIDGRVAAERSYVLEALEELQTGAIFGVTRDHFDTGERVRSRERLLPNVRLANGSVSRAARSRLMAGFNSPFFPEILVASSVMAEGVDLHLECRHVIHHDLNWNPSVLEQRTGRLDRLGSKSEVTALPIVVYEPFLEATQDEKQFRVVKDRERWFNVVMGEKLELDEHSTDQTAQRVPLPVELARKLSMDLSVTG